MDNKTYIAHKRKKDNELQLLHAHLYEVGELASAFAKKVGAENAGRLLGLLHDFGKYSQQFQNYIKSATGEINPDEDDYVDAKGMKGKVDHSTAGAHLVWKRLKRFGAGGQGELCGQILSLCIASHHSGLIDCFGIDDKAVFTERMRKPDEKVHLDECLQAADQRIMEAIGQLATVDLVKELFGQLAKLVNFNEPSTIDFFNLGFFTRFLFSCLIDADRLNSAEFEDPTRLSERLNNAAPVDWSVALARLEKHLAALAPRNYVDELRREISDNCKNNSERAQGIYTLTVPTGGGKTYASLRYALHHARHHALDRIIYVIPYTSIIEQNAKVIREVVEKDGDVRPWVLEHHSNLEPEQQTWQTKLVSENWDAPIVLTTMVQLLETLFSGGTKGVRRLHQLANSVLIFDEIQTLPVNCVHIFCNAINFLSQQANTTTVLCTATQPSINELKGSDKGQLIIPKENELAGDFNRHFNELRRVDVNNLLRPGGWHTQEIAELAVAQFNERNSCLVIVNTKAWAQVLYRRCAEKVNDSHLFHLSTNQCPRHRKILLYLIKKRLKYGKPVLCISTQLIEAGVDVDFASVIRFLAGLDSIAQAAGRCNRNGRLKDDEGNLIKGQVFVINPDKESTGLFKDIEAGKDKAERVLSEGYEDILSPEAIKQYFRYYFFDRADDMAYRLDGNKSQRSDNLLNLLSVREGCNKNFDEREGKIPLMRHAFMEAGKKFKAIDAPTQAVIIRQGKGCKLVDELCSAAKEFNAHRYYQLLRQAQKYSVNVFPNVWKKLLEQGAVHEVQLGHGIYYLDEEYYSRDFGLGTERVSMMRSHIL
ncbi:MAG: CRISPR-associated helicase Cas3' [Marinospirillum sp.]|uniref:CRISPR-associated helicase Cas3' n=1 Tax=Marinospirillum sp. TaxID=2183934 RepID=UPI001A00D4BF|nr:CRISPR-associated helicase Cas3' [Marinospirillum sp.]MBE0508181.1 CRISPR-associated helicase Cas3' [Marinospirillum sp.]